MPQKRKKPRGSGRKRGEKREGFVVHRARPAHDFRHPVHVTMRRKALGPDFRTQRVHTVILRELARARANGVRVVQHSIQADHLHLMIEGANAADLSTQMRKLFSRIAMMVNQIVKRRGSLFRDRHHRHALKTPREVRNALVSTSTVAHRPRKSRPCAARSTRAAPRHGSPIGPPTRDRRPPIRRPTRR